MEENPLERKSREDGIIQGILSRIKYYLPTGNGDKQDKTEEHTSPSSAFTHQDYENLIRLHQDYLRKINHIHLCETR